MLNEITKSSLLSLVLSIEVSEVFKSSVHDLSLGLVLSLGFRGSFKPRVLEGLSSTDTFFCRSQHVANQVLGFVWDSIPSASAHFVLASLDGLNNITTRWSIERWGSAQKDVEEDTNGPDINAVVVSSFKCFRSDIVRRTVNAMQKFILSYTSAWTEIDHLHNIGIYLVEVNVGGLDVTMNNSLRVKVSHGRQNLTNNARSLFLRNDLFSGEAFK